MHLRTDPMHNFLLSALPEADWLRWRPHLERVDMPLGQVLVEAGKSIRHVYFPTTAIVSRMYSTAEGGSFELAVIGREGMLGVCMLMGHGCESTPYEAVVTNAGQGYRVKPQFLLDEVARGGPILHLLLRYTQTQITQIAQQVVCNRHHALDQRLCNWMLTRLDRIDGMQLLTTHERIAAMLGVRREGVTAATLKLQRAGLISYARGRITVLDRPALERLACECYQTVKREMDRLVWPLNDAQQCASSHRRQEHTLGLGAAPCVASGDLALCL
jgi:CRP-like cAMP-binding protein